MACDVSPVVIFLAAEITQVIDSIPGVRCASGNVFRLSLNLKMTAAEILLLSDRHCLGQRKQVREETDIKEIEFFSCALPI